MADTLTHATLLIDRLEMQRHHILEALDGLDDAALRRPVVPSKWTALGLLQHLALDVERFWFRCIVAGDGEEIARLAEIDDAWQVSDEASAADVLDLYRQQIRLANDVVAGVSLDAPPRWWPQDQFGAWRLHTVGQVLLHVITETAVHAGHLDIARELIDGRQWLVLTA